MRYTNWQELHKKAYSNRSTPTPNPVSKFEESSLNPMELLHRQAWARLQKLCSPQELANLNYLAYLYDLGYRKHDTVFC